MNRMFKILERKYFCFVVLVTVNLTAVFGQQVSINSIKICSNECALIPVSIFSLTPPITYTLANATNSQVANTPIFTVCPSTSGVYTVFALDANNILVSDTAFFQVLPGPNLTVTSTATLNCNPGSAVISTTTSVTNALYNWQGPYPSFFSSMPSTTVLVSGIYTITVSDPNSGCKTSSFVTVYNQPNAPPPIFQTVPYSLNCLNKVVSMFVGSSVPNAQFNWLPGNVQGNAYSTSTPGDFTVQVLNPATNCITNNILTVVIDTIKPYITPVSFSISCLNDSIQIVAVTNTNTSLVWNGPTINLNSQNGTFIKTEGTYTAIATNTLNGCANSLSVFVNKEKISADFIANPPKGNSPLFVDFTNNSIGATSFNWVFGNGLTSTNINTTSIFNKKGTYRVTLYAIKGNCKDSAYRTIEVIAPIKIPEIFTPNNDGKNETYLILGLENYPDNVFEVYNRWGTLVFKEDGYRNNWDGYSNIVNTANKLPAGTYYLILYLNDPENTKFNGFIQLAY
jgi:gliding motility-associated-like protein